MASFYNYGCGNIRATLDGVLLELSYLELELTESILMREVESTNSVLHALASLGVKIAVNDFGTDYSCLSYLRQFPIDALKIDQSFVNKMTSNPEDTIIVSAKSAGVKVSSDEPLRREWIRRSSTHFFCLRNVTRVKATITVSRC